VLGIKISGAQMEQVMHHFVSEGASVRDQYERWIARISAADVLAEAAISYEYHVWRWRGGDADAIGNRFKMTVEEISYGFRFQEGERVARSGGTDFYPAGALHVEAPAVTVIIGVAGIGFATTAAGRGDNQQTGEQTLHSRHRIPNHNNRKVT
jgi:hypothetical protein